MLTFAGLRFYTVVVQIGRRSKRMYQTTVVGQPTEDGFVIPLPYGEDTDWCFNVLAAGGCIVHWNGQAFQLISQQIVERAVGEVAFPAVYRFLLHSWGVQMYLKASR